MKWRRFQVMSALPHKADTDARDCDVRFVPCSDIAAKLALDVKSCIAIRCG
jgi:hypothetical protein